MIPQLWHPNTPDEDSSPHQAHPQKKSGRAVRPKSAPANLTTTEALIEQCKASVQIESDYRLAKMLGCTHTAIIHWRNGKTRPDDLSVIRMARLMHRDPAPIVAELHAERAKDPESRELWLQIAEHLRGTGAPDSLK